MKYASQARKFNREPGNNMQIITNLSSLQKSFEVFSESETKPSMTSHRKKK